MSAKESSGEMAGRPGNQGSKGPRESPNSGGMADADSTTDLPRQTPASMQGSTRTSSTTTHARRLLVNYKGDVKGTEPRLDRLPLLYLG